ncbi:MAG: transketolase [Clostridia bacterium]|nr:transketolase [Clostridia bacterium]
MLYETLSLRDYVGKTLNALFTPRMYVLDGDLSGATRSDQFQKEHPQHFIECGISETSAVSIATGLAMEGMIPFYVNFALFCTGSAWSQVRMACYANANIKLLSTHPGMDNGPDGASHHANEDIALMRALPNMRILVPQSPEELKAAVADALAVEGPCYIRVSRDAVPVLPDLPAADRPFGGARLIRSQGDDFAILYEGTAMLAAVRGYDALREQGAYGRLIQVQTIKPFPENEILRLCQGVSKIVTIENHTVIGGLGGAMSEALAAMNHHPPLVRVGVPDVFTQSGPTGSIKARYGLSQEHIIRAVLER